MGKRAARRGLRVGGGRLAFAAGRRAGTAPEPIAAGLGPH